MSGKGGSRTRQLIMDALIVLLAAALVFLYLQMNKQDAKRMREAQQIAATATFTPTPEPTEEPTPEPTEEPTPEPTEEPTPEPTEEPKIGRAHV